MEDLMKVLGKTITCMVKEPTLGAMAENTRANTSWIKSMAMVSISGPMEEGTRAIGRVENSMEKENTYYLMGSQRSAFGKMVNA